MKIYLDDTRIPLDSFSYTKNEIYIDREWVVVKSYDEFKALINEICANDKFEEIELISYDHDLADEHYHRSMMEKDHSIYNGLYPSFQEKTGLDCVKYLTEVCMDTGHNLPDFLVHTQNPVGHINITSMLTNFKKHHNGNRA